jgi:hypothetical protein
MDARTVELYLTRAAAATSVRELHATVRALHRAHPADPDAERVERACWDRVAGLLTRASASVLGSSDRGTARADWKERAARMEFA